jgi:hypothetical protein
MWVSGARPNQPQSSRIAAAAAAAASRRNDNDGTVLPTAAAAAAFLAADRIAEFETVWLCSTDAAILATRNGLVEFHRSHMFCSQAGPTAPAKRVAPVSAH